MDAAEVPEPTRGFEFTDQERERLMTLIAESAKEEPLDRAIDDKLRSNVDPLPLNDQWWDGQLHVDGQMVLRFRVHDFKIFNALIELAQSFAEDPSFWVGTEARGSIWVSERPRSSLLMLYREFSPNSPG